jgi:DEAD/DEAH box helicase domain-containing protein
VLPPWLSTDSRVVHCDRLPGALGDPVPWPSWVPADLVHRAQGQGIALPWRHQVEAAEAFRSGRHVALSTGTSSGKSLAYLLPIIEATGDPAPLPAPNVMPTDIGCGHPRLPGLGEGDRPDSDDPDDDLAAQLLDAERLDAARPDLADLAAAARFRRTTALYLAPTKALAHDQLRNAWPLGPHGWRVTTLDGDSERDERRFARDYATMVLTNPDMLHASVLPNHTAWSSFLGGLRYVVVDEAHRYRGVFGAHVALVLRRLRRLCARYGAAPTFICSSATTVDAAEMMGRLIGEPSEHIVTVATDGSPRGARDIVFWQPSESTDADVAMLLGRFVAEGQQTLAFVASRRAAEQVARQARATSLTGTGGETITSYRGGYLPRERRAIEAALQTGALRGVATTNALELGVDIAGVDAVVIGGYPGSVASLWQQAGRAGRRGADATVVFVARNDPLDAYLLDHPEHVLHAPVEPTVLHPDNPAILGPHLGAAAQELPLTEDDERWFGPTLSPLLDRLTAHGTLRRRRAGWYWPHLGRAVDEISVRSTGGQPIEIIEEATGRIIGTVDPASADRVAHPGAVYLHQGEHWLVTDLDHETHEAFADAAALDYDTLPLTESEVSVRSDRDWRPFGRGEVHRGTVDVSTRVVAYLRRHLDTGRIIERVPLDLPSRTLQTHAMWFTLPASACPSRRLRGGAHGAEHALLSLLASVAGSDRSDVAGAFSARHPDTDAVTVFVYDTAPGGAGFAAAGFDRADTWLANALDRVTQCACETGCPRCCIVSGCPIANDDVDKAATVAILRAWASAQSGEVSELSQLDGPLLPSPMARPSHRKKNGATVS